MEEESYNKFSPKSGAAPGGRGKKKQNAGDEWNFNRQGSKKGIHHGGTQFMNNKLAANGGGGAPLIGQL
jgi:hypothetical protein